MALALALPNSGGAQDSAHPLTSAAAAWVASVVDYLKLSPEQKAALVSFQALVDDQVAQGKSITADQFRAMTYQERIEYYLDAYATLADQFRVRATAFHNFYALLTPEQRSQFDKATAPNTMAKPRLAPDTESSPLAPPPNKFAAPAQTDPSWLVKPTQGDLSRVYPSDARRKRLGGQVMLECTVDEDGYLKDCVVLEETPPGEGFGNAALEITAYMRMKPATRQGVPITSPLAVPVIFEAPEQGG